MSGTAASPRPASRRGAVWVPNQHGAWAMLTGPLLVGVLAGGFSSVHVPLALLWFLGYFAFFAAGLWLKARRKPRYLPPVVVYSLACVPFAALVLLWEPGLAVWGLVFAPLLVTGLLLAAERKDRALLSGLATTLAVAHDRGGLRRRRRERLDARVAPGRDHGGVLRRDVAVREDDDP